LYLTHNDYSNNGWWLWSTITVNMFVKMKESTLLLQLLSSISIGITYQSYIQWLIQVINGQRNEINGTINKFPSRESNCSPD
jgi:hypothetical protein